MYFKLENYLEIGEVIKIVWPYAFNATSSTVYINIYTTSSDTKYTGGAATGDTSNQAFLYAVTAKLNAD